MKQLIKIGVSACLLGELVRYDGAHKVDRYIMDVLGASFTLVPVCPEVGCGLPTPREAMRLEGDPSDPRLMTCRTRIDMTGKVSAYCFTKVRELDGEGLCGFIFKERSPSCGLTAVPLHGDEGGGLTASGLFAHEVSQYFPLMPLEEAERLSTPHIRKKFIDQVLSYRRKNVQR